MWSNFVLDDRFDHSDAPKLVKELQAQKDDFDVLEDELLLAYINYYPRFASYVLAQIAQYEAEAKARDILVPTVVDIKDRTDDWLSERRDEIKHKIAALKRADEELKAERDSIDQEFIRRFEERGTSGTRASRFTLSMRVDDNYPTCTDRTVFEEYLLKTGKLHLLQKRLSLSAVQEELAAMQAERDAYITRIDEAADKYDEAALIYHELNMPSLEQGDSMLHEYAIDLKIKEMLTDGTLVNTVKQQLHDRYTLPGIEVVTKLSVNQVKRNS